MNFAELHRHFNKGDTIFVEGEPGDCAYIVETGRIHLYILIDGKQKLICQQGDGSVFGEMSLLDQQLRSATAIAAEDCCLTVIPDSYFKEKIASADHFIAMLLQVLLLRYRAMRSRLESILLESGTHAELNIEEKSSDDCEQQALSAVQQLDFQEQMRLALQHGQFELFYQPIVSLQMPGLLGCEALIRWRDPQMGLRGPNEFISAAEENGLIVPIGLWVIQQATATLSRLQKLSDDFVFMSINLSGRQFVPEGLIAYIKQAIHDNHNDCQRIKFEITESILMANPVNTAQVLTDLKQLGVKIAIDDFGTGYSSFSYLHRFPIDTLKIDRSFVTSMLSDSKSLAIVKSLCSLAKSIGLTIVAEGVEREAEHQLLKDLGVEYGQGYLYAKPLTEAEFIDFMLERRTLMM